MFEIIQVESGIWVLEENGKNVFTTDCQQYGFSKNEKKVLFIYLQAVVETMREKSPLESYIKKGILKKLEHQEKASHYNFWEIRDEGRGNRLIFVMQEPNSIIVSAVCKNQGSLSQTINRGVNRWRKFLKQQEK